MLDDEEAQRNFFSFLENNNISKISEFLEIYPYLANAVNLLGYSSLQIASCAGQIEIVNLLISKGANVNYLGKWDRSALDEASFKGYLNVIKSLISAGADLGKHGRHGETPLFFAVKGKKFEIVKYFLNNTEIDVDAVAPIGSALCVASLYNHEEIFDFLLRKKANLNLTDSKGQNPLHLAAFNGNINLIHKIVNLSIVDIYQKNVEGLTALNIAQKEGHNKVEIYLLSLAGAASRKNEIDSSTQTNRICVEEEEVIVGENSSLKPHDKILENFSTSACDRSEITEVSLADNIETIGETATLKSTACIML